MLSIGVGRDPKATGYEKIFLEAALIGIKAKKVTPLVDEIFEFSELGNYLDVPVRTFSSGVAMRLAFAISTCISVDVILMVEWLSVAVATVREKAQSRLRNLLGQTKIFVPAFSDEALIRTKCNRIMHLDHGRIIGFEHVEA